MLRLLGVTFLSAVAAGLALEAARRIEMAWKLKRFSGQLADYLSNVAVAGVPQTASTPTNEAVN